MIKVGEHITIDFLSVKKDYSPSFYEKIIYKIAKAAKVDMAEGNLLAGTALSHEISHAIDARAFVGDGLINYGKNLMNYTSENFGDIHNEAMFHLQHTFSQHTFSLAQNVTNA